ncbi:disease resistance protein RPM1-like [Eucalyptus grandis]|uniref:disease resistance protein RPM1-like n=1 Tax=Eucalyptus grandis TaxID=71139 RepID=UPI00192EF0AD|nr:disease resistance protein RPM1-like [Eucalyptus grandis]
MKDLWLQQKEEIKLSIRGEGTRQGNLGCTLIWGEQGVGKTYVTRCVYNEAKYLGFEWCAWVRLSAGMDIQDFLFEILQQMGKLAREVKDMNLHEMTEMHRIELAKRKKFLIVLDGMHPSNERLLPSGLLLNAGDQERAALEKDRSKMSTSELLQLSYHKLAAHLKPCFIYMVLFPRAAPISTRRLVRLWLAEGLLDSHCYDGERKLTRQPEAAGETFILDLAGRNVIEVVSWRADGFPKACYMLTSLYDLIHPIAMDTKFLHIHAASKSKDENDCGPTSQQQQLPAHQYEIKVRWLAEHTNIVRDSHGGSYPGLNLNHVRSFLSFYMRRGMLTKEISNFLRNMTSKTAYSLLRVLDLEGVYRPSLEGVLHKLVLLKYLGLRSTVLHSIPSAVADLQYLETLDIKDTYITSLPNSFWKARNLRHLHLNWLYIDLKKIFEDDNALTKLQTLSGLVIGEVKENSVMGHMNSLTTLKLFLHQLDRDTSGTAGKALADWISSRLTYLQSLTLGVTKNAKPAKSQIGPLPKLSLAEHHGLFVLYLLGRLNKPIWTQLLPVSLRVLILSGSRVEADMMPELGGLLGHLRTLKLLANSFLGTSLTFAKGGFPSLMILKIWKLPQLVRVTIKEGAMPRLIKLEFRHLECLKTVEGIHECKILENFSVMSQCDALVNQLRDKIGEKVNLHFEDSKRPGSSADDEDEDEDEDEDS